MENFIFWVVISKNRCDLRIHTEIKYSSGWLLLPLKSRLSIIQSHDILQTQKFCRFPNKRKWKLCLSTTAFFKQHFFSSQLQCGLTFSWIDLQMLFRCCLIRISIIILWHILHLVYLCPSLGVQVYLCHIFVIYFSFSVSFSLPLII